MNNEMNNGTNNTNPGQVVDNNTNNQPAMVNNGQNVDNSQQTNNGQAMNLGNQSMNNQPMGMPTNNQQPMMNNQNFNGNLMPNPNQKSNKTLFIVIGVAILVVIAAVVLINVTSSNKSKGNTINDFDNNGSNNQGQVSNDDDDNYDDDDYDDDDSYVSNSSITYKGFSIPKQKGYEYEIDYDALGIGNDTFATMVSIAYGDMANAEAIVNESIKEYQTEGYSATNAKSDSYNGKKAYTFEITSPKGINVIWYLMEADAGYLFYGLSANDKYIIDYKDVETTVSLLANAKYNGEYKLTSDEIKMIKPDNLFK